MHHHHAGPLAKTNISRMSTRFFVKTIPAVCQLLLLGGACSLNAQTPSFQWFQQLGGGSENVAQTMSLDAQGNRFIVGLFKGRFTIDNASLTSLGIENNLFIAKLNAQGEVLWLRQAQGGEIYASCSGLDPSGNLLVGGTFVNSAAFGETTINSRGSSDMFLVKYSSGGDLLWVRQAGGPGTDHLSNMAMDGLGNCFLTGNIGPNSLFSGGGLVKTLSVSATDMFLARYDSGGGLVWATTPANTGGGSGFQVRYFHGSNNLLVSGTRNGGGFLCSYAAETGTFEEDICWMNGDSRIADFVAESPEVVFALCDIMGNSTLQSRYGAPWELTSASTLLRKHVLFCVTRSGFRFVQYQAKATGLALDGRGGLYRKSPVAKVDTSNGELLWGLAGTTSLGIVELLPEADGSLLAAGWFPGPSMRLGSFTLATSAAFSSFVARISEVPAFDWVQKASGAQVSAGAKAVAVDAAGNRLVTGWFSYTASFSGHPLQSVNGSQDIFLAKYDAAGTLLWVRPAGGPEWDQGTSVAVDRGGNCYLTGYFEDTAAFGPTNLVSRGGDDVFVAKYNSQGVLQWVMQFGGPGYDYGGAVALDAGGNAYLAGYFEQTAQVGNTELVSRGNNDVLLAKFSSGGAVQWVKQAGDSGDDRAFGLAVDPVGNCYVAGYFSFYANFDTIDINGFGDADIFLAKYNSAGVVQWVRKAGGQQRDIGYGAALDANGNPYLVGIFQDTADFGGVPLVSSGMYDGFTAKYTSTGNCTWARRLGGVLDDQANAIAVDREGNCYVTGQFEDEASFPPLTLTSSGEADAFLLKLDATGEMVWVKKAGGANDDAGNGVAIAGEQNWSCAGYFSGTAQFDRQTLFAAYTDLFLASAKAMANTRVVNIPNVEGVLGQELRLPVHLTSQGDENALAMTVVFDPTVLTNVAVSKGDGTSTAGIYQMVVNNTRAGEGLLGVIASLVPGVNFSAGATQVLTLTFTVLANTPAASTVVGFGDQVVMREIANARGEYLSADYVPGTVTLIRGYEGDVSPAGGNNEVTLSDWVRTGMFVTGLATVTPGDEAIRADCSPYVLNNVPVLGDGRISLADWVQVGRIAAGLDKMRPQGGPSLSKGGTVAGASKPAAGEGTLNLAGSTIVKVQPLNLGPGEAGSLEVQVEGSGQVNGAAFSLTLDPALLAFTGGELAGQAAEGSLVLNTNHLDGGQLGVLLALPSGKSLSPGVQPVLRIGVRALPTSGNWTSRLDLVNFPVTREVVDTLADMLPADYVGSSAVIAPPVARISKPLITGGGLQFTAENFGASGALVIEASEDLVQWAPVYTNSSPAGVILVPGAMGYPHRDFRARY
jgi:Tfp pilus assembly protein PilZ